MKTNEFIGNWPAQNKDSWLRQIIEENAAKVLPPTNFRIEDEIFANAFAFPTDVTNEGNVLKSNGTLDFWKSGLEIRISNLEEAKLKLDQALTQGAEYIHFIFELEPDIKTTDYLLHQVYLDLIASRWSFDATCDLNNFKNNLLDKYGKSCKIYQTGAAQNNIKNQVDLFSRFYVSNLNSWADNLINLLENLKICNKINEHIIFEIYLNHDFLLNICASRALKLVIHKLWATLNISILPIIELHIDRQSLTSDFHSNLYKIASICLSASIANGDYIVIPDAKMLQSSSELQAIKSTLHIQHILKQEAYMDRLLDASAGSYFMEDLTEKISKNIWFQLQNKLNT